MISKSINRLKNYPIKCFHYNDRLDGILKSPQKYTTIIYLSQCGTELVIKNKKYYDSFKLAIGLPDNQDKRE